MKHLLNTHYVVLGPVHMRTCVHVRARTHTQTHLSLSLYFSISISISISISTSVSSVSIYIYLVQFLQHFGQGDIISLAVQMGRLRPPRCEMTSLLSHY